MWRPRVSTRSRQRGRPSRRGTAARTGSPTLALSSPWAPRIFVGYAVITALGAVLFLVGIGVVANETVYDDQVPGINAAIAGAAVANAAGALLLLVGRRSVTVRRVAVLGAAPDELSSTRASARSASSVALVGGAGLTHFHRSDCALAAGRNWPTLDRVAHQRAGRRPCGVCTP